MFQFYMTSKKKKSFVGTLKSNKRQIPVELKNVTNRSENSFAFRKEGTKFLTYHGRKRMLFLFPAPPLMKQLMSQQDLKRKS